MSMLMDFRRACGFWPGGRYQKRPMVWDTCEVCETTSCTQHNANISPWAPFWHYSLASKSKPEVDLYGVSVAFPCLPLPSQARASQKCIFTTFWHNSQHLHPPPSLQASVLAFSTSLVSSRWCVDIIFTSTSLACKMISMLVNPSYCLHQIYNLARLHGSVNWHLHGSGYPRVFENPYLNPLKPVPLGQMQVFYGCGYGSPWNTRGLPMTIPTSTSLVHQIEPTWC